MLTIEGTENDEAMEKAWEGVLKVEASTEAPVEHVRVVLQSCQFITPKG